MNESWWNIFVNVSYAQRQSNLPVLLRKRAALPAHIARQHQVFNCFGKKSWTDWWILFKLIHRKVKDKTSKSSTHFVTSSDATYKLYLQGVNVLVVVNNFFKSIWTNLLTFRHNLVKKFKEKYLETKKQNRAFILDHRVKGMIFFQRMSALSVVGIDVIMSRVILPNWDVNVPTWRALIVPLCTSNDKYTDMRRLRNKGNCYVQTEETRIARMTKNNLDWTWSA